MRQGDRAVRNSGCRDPCLGGVRGNLLAEVVELRVTNEQLVRALASRAVIDQARGVVMALAPCSSDRAWHLLVDVSQHCNIKLRDVAAALVATTTDRTLPEPIQRELRRALRCLGAVDRR
ncbi:hypothetical protein SALBM311S_04201 [Streptomyces alboniger]